MKIQLSQDEIAQAVRDYVSKGVTLAGNTQMAVDFSMGRGDNGLSATIDVPYMGVSSLPVTPAMTAAAPAVVPAAAPAAAAPTFQAFGANVPTPVEPTNVAEITGAEEATAAVPSTPPAGSLFTSAAPQQ